MTDGLKFRCLVPQDFHPIIDEIASEVGAEVQYFRGRLGVVSVHLNGEYLGFVSVSGKDRCAFRAAIGEMLSRWARQQRVRVSWKD